MAKRKRDRQNNVPAPTATNVDWPVYVPNGDGTSQLEVGRARLRFGTLVVEFKDSGPADAIQNMIQRGAFLGFNIVQHRTDVVNEMYQEVVAEEEAEEEANAKIADAVARGVNSGLLEFDSEGKLQSVDGIHSAEDIVKVLMNLDQIEIEKPIEEEKNQNHTSLSVVTNDDA